MNIFYSWRKNNPDTPSSNTFSSNILGSSLSDPNASSSGSNIDFPELPTPEEIIRNPSVVSDVLFELEETDMLIKKESIMPNLENFASFNEGYVILYKYKIVNKKN